MGVVCYKPTGNATIDSFRTTTMPRAIQLASGLSSGIMSLGVAYQNNKVLCRYRRMLNGSGNFMADLTTDQFAIWAYGATVSNNIPQAHDGQQYGASPMAVNLQFNPMVI